MNIRLIRFFLNVHFLSMAKVNGPLFSLSARGQIGHAIVYSIWKGREYVRKWVVPANPRTLAQTFQRGVLSALSHWWSDITDAYKLSWQPRAAAHNYSQFNAYTSQNLNWETDGTFPSQQADTDRSDTAPHNPQAPSGTGGVNRITCNMTAHLSQAPTDLLMLTLGTDSGANSTADSIHRVLNGFTGFAGAETRTFDVLNIPAGTYYLGCIAIGATGVESEWVHSGSAVTVTGEP